MFAKISFKKLMTLLLGVLIIGALTNCGGSSGGGGGGSAAPADKKPVEKAPDPGKEDPGKEDPNKDKEGTEDPNKGKEGTEDPNKDKEGTEDPDPPVKEACSDSLDIKILINDMDEQCLFAGQKTLGFVLNSIASSEGKRTWDNSDVTVVLSQISEDATAKPECVTASGKSVEQGWALDFSSSTSCAITVSLKNNSAIQVVYTLNVAGYGISEAADFESDFFASESVRFVLTTDIVLEAEEEKAYFASSFKGQLDGSGHTISGLSIDAGTDADDVGLISKVALSADDSTVEIKNLTLVITSLTGKKNVGGLIGMVDSIPEANAVEIKDVAVEFADTSLQCDEGCGGLVGRAKTSVHFSSIALTGAVSSVGRNFGGVVGRASGMQLSEVNSTLSMNHSEGDAIGLVAGFVEENSTLSHIDASGTITCTGSCERVGGVVGYLEKSSVSAVKSVLTLVVGKEGIYIGGVVGYATLSSVTRLYAKLIFNNDNAQVTTLGAAVGQTMAGRAGPGSFELLVSNLELSSNGHIIIAGGAAGHVGNNVSFSRVFASGSFAGAGRFLQTGQLFGQHNTMNLVLQHSYTGSFTGDETPKLAVHEIGVSSTIANSYTRADKFLPDDAQEVVFLNVYATTEQKGSVGKSEILPNPFEASILNVEDDITIWTNEYDGKKYTYPMLSYPKEDMGPVSEADWFEFQIKDNEVKQ